MFTGYQHSQYAYSLEEFGTPYELPNSGGWLLKRQIPDHPYYDLMGCYPLFSCQNWAHLHDDLENIGTDLVSLSLVTDPFGNYELPYLKTCFKDVVIPFKEHFVVDLSQPIEAIVSKHHRYYTRKSIKNIQVEKCHNPISHLDEWVNIYATLVEKHNLKGIKAFSKMAFAKQLAIPGMVMFVAKSQFAIQAVHLWYQQGEVAYSHLAASSSLGYELMASYALYWFAIEYFSNKVRWLNIGSGSGTTDKSSDGLSKFKKGWSTGTRTAYFCGRIFDQKKYLEIVEAKGIDKTNYFPAYRAGEFI